jgi:hypothetical protein
MFGINKSGYVRSRYDAEIDTAGTDYNPKFSTVLPT